MGDKSGIQWTDATWNPVRGCTRVSPGCVNCYAERQALRMSGRGPYEGLVRIVNGHPTWTGDVRLASHKLDEPLRWKSPRRIFVNSMSDLFHEDVPATFIDQVFAVMALAPKHTFQVLTKRPERMQRYVRGLSCGYARLDGAARALCWTFRYNNIPLCPWPIPNVWIGVSVEDQQRADERIPLLLETPAAVRFVSTEPLLGPIDLRKYLIGEEVAGHPFSDPPARTVGGCVKWIPPLDWVIVGGESGPGARTCDVAWVRSIVAQCREAQIPCFVKQLGARSTYPPLLPLHDRKGGNPAEWPRDLRVREYPR